MCFLALDRVLRAQEQMSRWELAECPEEHRKLICNGNSSQKGAGIRAEEFPAEARN
jgi:hypothetical protein